MERIWKLAVYIFWIVASTALILLAYVLSGNQYSALSTFFSYYCMNEQNRNTKGCGFSQF